MQTIQENGIMVTIRCLTYNHEPYIRQCLDGFVMQKTNFRYEAIVHDDASTDGTAAIIKEYAAKYPDIIKPIFETENQYSRKDGSLRRIMNNHMHGKYIAMCEGDDYWTDPMKLQKQVDFMESHSDYVMCTHYYRLFWQDKNSFVGIEPIMCGDLTYDLDYYIKYKWVTTTLTTLCRTSAFVSKEYDNYRSAKDMTLFYFLLKQGKGYLLDDVMAVYRMHKGGVWSNADDRSRITSDCKTLIGIYEVERSYEAALFIKNYLLHRGYLGGGFFLANFQLYYKLFCAILNQLGWNTAVSVLFRSINFIGRYSMIIYNRLRELSKK